MLERIKTEEEKIEEARNPTPIIPAGISQEEIIATIERILEFQNRDIMAQFKVFDFATNVATGDGKYYFHTDRKLHKSNLVYVHAKAITAGSGAGTTDIQIANVTKAVDMLTTKLTIDSGETGSNTAATPAKIDITKNEVEENDLLRVDVDAISATPPQGLLITLGFEERL